MTTFTNECKRFVENVKEPIDWEVVYHAGAMKMMGLMSEIAQNVPEDRQEEVLDRYAQELGAYAAVHFPSMLDEKGDFKPDESAH